ncbi:MAG TPA: pyroglutamyl-peptidase I [Hyphomicrobium sp.]|nr:pyroglutamyl-peptidase I [Hyphomicrobium sp.]
MLDPNKRDLRPTILLTGFGPFPGVPINVSADLARKTVRIARRTFPACRFHSSVLPTEWRRAPALVATLHDRYRPILALHFGVASGTQGFRLEARAENVCRALLDAAGMPPPADRICADGPAERPTTIKISAIAKTLEARGFPCTISDDAGGYLCNAVLYQSLASAEMHGGAAGFIHIPSALISPPLTMKDAVGAALDIIAVCHGAAPPAMAPWARA